MSNHSGWLGILKWSLAQGDDTASPSKFEPMSEVSVLRVKNFKNVEKSQSCLRSNQPFTLSHLLSIIKRMIKSG
jgi:hypothetical protein